MDYARMNVLICGRSLGTALRRRSEGWDRVDDNCLFFYDFQPLPTISLPAGLQVNFETGDIEI